MILIPTVRSALRAGLCLLPVREDGSKAPAVSSWRTYQTTRPTLDEIKAWDFGHRAGVGMVAGAVSGHRETWDFDDADVFAAFVAAADASGLGAVVTRIRRGYEDETPRGGRRWIVQYPAPVEWRDVTLARRPGPPDPNGRPTVTTLIECPTFAVLAPSNGSTHPTGKPYVRVSGDPSTIASYAEDERDALRELARSFDAMPRHTAREPAPATIGGSHDVRPGDHFNQRTTWPALLEPAGWTFVFERGGTSFWRRPGKTHGVSATTNHGGSDLFYPFTSSSVFDPERSYSKFGVFAALHHNGDFAQAALALSRHGYGAPATRTTTHSQRPPQPAPANGPAWRWLGTIKREYVSWLWPSRLAFKTLTLWIGDGGLGKSRASNDLAARVTTGALWPDGECAPLGRMIILSAEDSPSYTIRPAIEAAGGDVSCVAILDAVRDAHGTERTFNLGTDLAALEQLLDATQASLIIIDPLSAYFGTALDSYRDTDVRSVLEPVAKLAERRSVAVLGIMHVGKSTDRQARHRALGSVAFVNAARMVFAVGPHPEDDSRRVLACVKPNLCREPPALAFRLEDADGVARVVWEAGPVTDVTADTVLAGTPRVSTDDDQTDAESLIRRLLAEEAWPLDSREALAAGKAHGIAERTMQRTARRLGITVQRRGFGRKGGWEWHRPSSGNGSASIDDTIDVSVSSVSSMASMENPSVKGAIPAIDDRSTFYAREVSSMEPSRLPGPDDDLPACLRELTEPDYSDPIGAHDEDDGV